MVRLTYHTVKGQIRSAGVSSAGKVEMMRHPLGSVVQTINGTDTPGVTQRFAPYGTPTLPTSDNVQTGTDLRKGWVGSYGYRRTSMNNAERYVRARHYSQASGRWTSRDPWWPFESPLTYARSRPTRLVDQSGALCENPFSGFAGNNVSVFNQGRPSGDQLTRDAVRKVIANTPCCQALMAVTSLPVVS